MTTFIRINLHSFDIITGLPEAKDSFIAIESASSFDGKIKASISSNRVFFCS